MRSLQSIIGMMIVALWAHAAMADTDDYSLGATLRVFHPAHARNWRGARTEALVTRIWYPADVSSGLTPHDIGPPGRPMFRGHPVAVDAPVSMVKTRYPLILLSHGTGGSADSLDWLGSDLADAGAVVVAVNHPGNNALEPLTPDGFRLWWERATDLSDALDAILTDPRFASRIDRSRIGAVGFSLGGYTVLELAGARTEPGAFEAFCGSPAADATCHPPEMGGVAPALTNPPSSETAASLARAGASYRDARVKAVFAIAPALGMALDPKSLKTVTIPLTLVAGDADAIAPVNTNIRRLAAFLPAAETVLIKGAGHYTFLDSCTPEAMAALPSLCRDGPGVDRDAVHRAIVVRARAFFVRTLR